MMAKGKRIGREEEKNLEKVQVIAPRSSHLTAQKKRQLIIVACVVKIY